MSIPDPQLEMKIHQYISGQLPEAEALEFEASFLSDPDVIAMIESEQALRQGLLAAEQNIFSTNAESQTNSNDTHHERWHRKLAAWLLSPIAVPAIALPLLAVCVIPFISISSDTPDALGNIMIVNGATEVTRSVAGPQDYMLMDLSTPMQVSSAVLIKVQTSARPYEQYRLKVISAEAGTLIWVSEPFKLNSLGHGLVIVPDHAAINDTVINVSAVGDKGADVAVKFCHYSEVCR